MTPDQVRAILLALAIGGALALQQDQPDELSARPAPVEEPKLGPDPGTVSPLSSMLREQLSRQQRPLATSTVPPTTTSQSPAESQTTVSSVPKQPPNPTASGEQFQFVRPQVAPKCSHNNQTYAIGQKWNDDCLQVCECVRADEGSPVAVSACRPRCPIYKDPPGDNCALQRSKTDQCCLDWLCESDAKLAGTSAPPTSTSTITTTTVNTSEPSGQLNVSTIEIRMPTAPASSSTTTSTTARPSSTTPAPTTTTSPTSAAFRAQQLLQQALARSTSAAPVTTTTGVSRQPPTTTGAPPTTTMAPTTTRAPATTLASSTQTRRMQPSAAASSRAPKQVSHTLAPATTTTTTTTTSARPSSTPPPPTSTPSLDAIERLASTMGSDLDEADPEEHDLCIEALDASAYWLNQTWLEEPCDQRCRCVFRSEPRNPMIDVRVIPTLNMKNNSEQTEIRCELPPYCSNTLKLTAGPFCLNPRLVFPQQSLDRCACPKVACLTDKPPPIRPFVEDVELEPSSAQTSDYLSTTATVLIAATTTTSRPATATSNAASTTTSRTTTTTTTTTATPPTTTTTATSSSSPTSSSTSTTTNAATSPDQLDATNVILKPDVATQQQQPPCSRGLDSNHIDANLPLAWTDQFQSQVNAPLQRYAWHLLVAFTIMTVLFTIVSCLYLRKTSRVMAPITPQSAYDNPTFTKLVSYCHQQALLVDENSQNYNNDAIMAKHKNFEVDKSSPLHYLNGQRLV